MRIKSRPRFGSHMLHRGRSQGKVENMNLGSYYLLGEAKLRFTMLRFVEGYGDVS